VARPRPVSEHRSGPLAALLGRVVEVRAEEVRALLWSCTYFFCILSAYYILRPLRDEMAVAGGVRNIPWLFTGTLVAMLVVNPPFAALVTRLTRKRFVSITYRFFMFNLLVFFVLLRVLPESQSVWVGRAFYVWTAVFNLFIVSVFWAFMADIFTTEQGKRLFGFIGVGGTLGGIVGSAITAGLVQVVGTEVLLLISIVLLEAGVFAVRRLSVLFESWSSAGSRAVAEKPIGGSVWAGLTHVVRSPYLLGIVSYMLLFTIAATFLYFQQADIIDRTYDDRALRTALFAKIDLIVNVLTIVTQLFLTGRIIKALGVAFTLGLLPLLCVAGFATLGLAPTLAVIITFQVLRRAANYAVARPTREVLYTVVSREDKYKAKALIDTFVYRGGDQIGAWSWSLMGALGLSIAGVAFAAVPVSAVWLIVAVWLGRKQEIMAGPSKEPDGMAPAVVPVG